MVKDINTVVSAESKPVNTEQTAIKADAAANAFTFLFLLPMLMDITLRHLSLRIRQSRIYRDYEFVRLIEHSVRSIASEISLTFRVCHGDILGILVII